MTTTEQTLVTVRVGEHNVEILTGETTDGHRYLRLRGIDCNLEGEEPGLYFPTPLDTATTQEAS